MKDKNLTILLHIIKYNGNINKLVRTGVSFKEITNLTDNAIEKGYLIYENERINVTEEGNEFLNQTSKILKNTNKNEWIEKDFKNQVKRIDKNFIFLPSQNELSIKVFY